MKKTVLYPGEELILRRKPRHNLQRSKRCNGYCERIDLAVEGGQVATVILHYALLSMDKIKAHKLWRVSSLKRTAADRVPEAEAYHFRCDLLQVSRAAEATRPMLTPAGQIVWLKDGGRREHLGRGQQGRPSVARMCS